MPLQYPATAAWYRVPGMSASQVAAVFADVRFLAILCNNMRLPNLVAVSLVIAALFTSACARASSERVSEAQTHAALRRITTDPQISLSMHTVARAALRQFPDKLKPDNFAIALILDTEHPVLGGYNMDTSFYPASVVKLAYAAALEHDFATGRLTRDPATMQDLASMLRVSSNAATNRILDRLSGTQSGPQLPPDELKVFAEKRQVVNHYLQQLGLKNINACQKTWDVEPYGRDTQFLGEHYENRNTMTAADTAKLVWLIKHGDLVSRPACDEILSFMQRRPGNQKDIQARRIGSGIPPESQLWSKAGWTDNTNHDAAYVIPPMGDAFVLVVFTKTSWQNGDIISWIARDITSKVQLKQLLPQWPSPVPGRPFGHTSGGK